MPATITEKCTGCTMCVRYCPVDAIQGEKLKPHSIDARLCIDCNACGRVCAFDAVLNAEGKPVEHTKPADWARPVWDYQTCVACNICVQACPTGVIRQLSTNGNGKNQHYPYLADAKACIGCAFCAQACPVEAISMRAPQGEKA